MAAALGAAYCLMKQCHRGWPIASSGATRSRHRNGPRNLHTEKGCLSAWPYTCKFDGGIGSAPCCFASAGTEKGEDASELVESTCAAVVRCCSDSLHPDTQAAPSFGTGAAAHRNSPHRLVARTSRCGRDNPGSTPGVDMYGPQTFFLCIDFLSAASAAHKHIASRLIGRGQVACKVVPKHVAVEHERLRQGPQPGRHGYVRDVFPTPFFTDGRQSYSGRTGPVLAAVAAT